MSFAEENLSLLFRRMKLDAVLFWSLENIRLLCGFTGSDGALIYGSEERIFLSDSRYEEQAKAEVQAAAFQKYRKKFEGVAQRLRAMRVKRLGFEAATLSWEGFQKLKVLLPRVILVPLSGEIAGLRSRKDPEEIQRIRRAVEIASGGFLDMLSRVKPGVREKTLRDFLEMRMRRRGGEETAFPTIVASGPRAALPHGKASEKELKKGEMTVIDFGARYEGYNSDETKTLILGRPDPLQKKIYDLVRKAQERAIKAVRPGESVRRIDAAARDIITRAGYGKYFGHGTGHGIGLAVHEPPTLSPRGSGFVQEGMVSSIEPGVYLPGWGGVRLEDLVLVTGRGGEVLSPLSKELKDNII